MVLTELEKSIVKTLVYFDLGSYPLTAVEVWRWLYNPPLINGQPPSLDEVSELLDNSVDLNKLITRREGFYCLQDRHHLVKQRKQANLEADKKLRKVVRYIKLFRLIPSIKMIAVCNSLASGNVSEQSDIDLFIVTEKNKIWVTRFLLVGILKILRKRPTLANTKDKICLSYYITTDALDLEKAQQGSDDIVFTYYVDGFLPLYDPDGIYKKLHQTNRWVASRLPNSDWPNAATLEVGRPDWIKLWYEFFNVISWPIFNRHSRDWLCHLQLSIMPDRLKSLANVDSRVIVTDNVLKFHDQDNRLEVRQQWLNKTKNILDYVD